MTLRIVETIHGTWHYHLTDQPKDGSSAQAVAWHTDDHLTDKSATTYDPVVVERWRAKGWPVTPHYTHPQPPSIPDPPEVDEAVRACQRRIHGFMLDCNAIGLLGAAENLHKGLKQDAATLTAALKPAAGSGDA